MARLFSKTPGTEEGKFLVLRRDGSVPNWPHFVLGGADPVVPWALRAYAIVARVMGYDRAYCRDVWNAAREFAAWRKAHHTGDPDAPRHRTDNAAVIHMMRTGQPLVVTGDLAAPAIDKPPLLEDVAISAPFGRDYLGNVRQVPHERDVANRGKTMGGNCRYCGAAATCSIVWTRGALGKPGPVWVPYCGSCSIAGALAKRGMTAPVSEGEDYRIDHSRGL